jgi:hypothetical protein
LLAEKVPPVATLGVMVIPDSPAFVMVVCVVASVTDPMVWLFTSPVEVKEVLPVPVEITVP